MEKLCDIVGEGNGIPLQYSCLENPMDGGAWYAAVHGVAKSRARLSDFTLTFHFSLSCIGEGNGSPLQYSCLENPRDWGAWWAAIYGVTQSRIRLTLLSSSSSSFGRPGGSPWTSHSLELFLVGCGVRASVFHSLLGANKFRPSICGHCYPSDFTPLLSTHAPKQPTKDKS